MSEATVSLRDRRQITLPAEVVAAVGLELNDTMQVRVVNGTIVLKPSRLADARPASMARFVGAARSAFGSSAEEADALVRQERDAW